MRWNRLSLKERAVRSRPAHLVHAAPIQHTTFNERVPMYGKKRRR